MGHTDRTPLLRKLFNFHGGVKPNANKQQSAAQPICTLPLSREYVVPLHQSIGGTPQPLVVAGDRVLRGQRIGAADGNVSSAVHAPTSGCVVAIEERLMPHASGLSAPCVVIEADGLDEAAPRENFDWRSASPDAVRDYLRDAGVVGLGGAVFPSHLKLKANNSIGLETLIINGAECEPFITCDDRLMQEKAREVIEGVALMAHLMQAKQTLIGIEDNKPDAIAAMQAAAQTAGQSNISVVAIPTRYPAGGAKQLIRVLTGIEVPHGKRSTDYGVQCFNVGTAFAIRDALENGLSLTARVVTVTGNVERPGNYWVRIGTPMRELVEHAGIKSGTERWLMGGPMMGVPMPSLDVPVVKATNCILAGSAELFAAPEPEMPCIRCGECAQACPADLQPFEMYWHSRARNFGKAQEYHLFDCIECGCCSYVCPSHIPLVDYYRFAKSEIWAREKDKTAADQARDRYEFRNYRIEREKEEKAARLAAKTAAGRAAIQASQQTTMGDAAPSEAADDPKKAMIAAAMQRAQAQKAAAQPQNTDHLTAAQQAEVDNAEARRARARELVDQNSSAIGKTSTSADTPNKMAD